MQTSGRRRKTRRAVSGRSPTQSEKLTPLDRAMAEAAKNKTTAELVSLASYRTLTNWLDECGVSR